jgi:hypothetical protein
MVKVANINAEIAELKSGKISPKTSKISVESTESGKRHGRPKKALAE